MIRGIDPKRFGSDTYRFLITTVELMAHLEATENAGRPPVLVTEALKSALKKCAGPERDLELTPEERKYLVALVRVAHGFAERTFVQPDMPIPDVAWNAAPELQAFLRVLEEPGAVRA